MKKPILLVVALFIAGILCARYTLPPIIPLYFILLCLIAALLFFYLKRYRVTIPALFSCIFLLGMLHFIISYYPSPQDVHRHAHREKTFYIKGRVVSSPYLYQGERKRVAFLLEAEKIREDKKTLSRWQQVEGKIWVNSFYPYKNFEYGDVVLLKGKLSLPQGDGEGNFNWRDYLSFKGVFSQVNTGKVQVVEKKKGNPLLHLAFLTAGWIEDTIDKCLPHPFSATLKGMMLGEKEDLPPDILSSFRTTGTAHVLVVSGLHVGLLFFFVFALIRIAGFSKRIALGIALPVIVYYALLTGLRPPIVRTSLMAGIGIICFFLDRQVPLLAILSLAAFIILIINPLSLFTVSFQLSFLAVGGIVHLTPYLLEKMRSLPPALKKPFSVSFAAQLSLLPLLAFYFGQFPLIGFVANLIIIPLLSLILSLGFFSLVLAIFTLKGAQIFFNTGWLILKGLLFLVSFLSFPWAPYLASIFSPKVAAPPVWILLIYYTLLIALPLSSSFSLKRKIFW